MSVPIPALLWPSSRRLRRLLSSAALVILAATCIPGAARATVVKRMSLPEMVERADNVVQVRAVDNTVLTDPDTGHHYTVTSFEVLDGAKGPMRPGERFEVEVPGGQAPGSNYATIVAAAPRFAVGEELVLFTTPGAHGRKIVVGFFQGAVRLTATPSGPVVTAAPPEFLPVARGGKPATAAAPVAAVDRNGTLVSGPAAPVAPGSGPPVSPKGGAVAAGAHTRAALTVATFLERIRAIEAAQRGGVR